METGSHRSDVTVGVWSSLGTSSGMSSAAGVPGSEATSTLGGVVTSEGMSSANTSSADLVSMVMRVASTEASSALSQNATLPGDLGTTGSNWATKGSDVIVRTTTYMPYYEYNMAQFEVLLPCIFGMFVVLALSFIVFYSKQTNQYEVLEKRPSNKNKAVPTQDWSTSNGFGEMNGAFSFE